MKKLCLLLSLLILVLAGCADSTPERTPGPTPDGTTAPSATAASPNGGAAVPSNGTLVPNTSAAAEITAEEARTIALAHAGLTADQVTRLHTEPDKERNGLHYDVEFHYDGYEYDYEIDAATGAVIAYEKEQND